jgi:LacI family transcriptional regulator
VSRTTIPRVAVLVDTATGWGRRLVQGVMHYTQGHNPWHLWVEGRSIPEHLMLLSHWKGDGIIARISTEKMARELKRLKVPVVNVSTIRLNGFTFPRVTTDVHAVGKLAAQYFLDRSLRNFAYYGTLRARYMAAHRQAFADAVQQAGYPCAAYRPLPQGASQDRQQHHLVQWLRQLPKPVAILTWSLQGLTVLHACQDAALRVPDDVAVLAGDEDDVLCQTSVPPLSGLEVPSELMGREAARMLDQLMAGQKLPSESVLLEPTQIVTRPSTDTLAIADDDMVGAIRFIREHARERIDVSSVLEVVAVSRRRLERRFLELLGRTPAEEIRRVRLDIARRLLIETDMPVAAVASASGFGSSEYMSYAFKEAAGLSPREYRSRQQRR